MTKKKPKRPRDPSQLAKMMVDIATSERGQEATTVQANRKHVGGVKGGKARAKVLTPRQRSEIAHVAATARWKKPKD